VRHTQSHGSSLWCLAENLPIWGPWGATPVLQTCQCLSVWICMINECQTSLSLSRLCYLARIYIVRSVLCRICGNIPHDDVPMVDDTPMWWLHDDNNMPKVAPHFTCRQCTFNLHTHASINHLIFKHGKKALLGKCDGACKLSLNVERHWNALTSVAVLQKLTKFKISSGHMLRT